MLKTQLCEASAGRNQQCLILTFKEKNKSTQMLNVKLLRPCSAERSKVINKGTDYVQHVRKANSYVIFFISVKKLFGLEKK